MKVSERKFLACQVFYGLCVSNPRINTAKKAKPLIAVSFQTADAMIDYDKKNPRKRR